MRLTPHIAAVIAAGLVLAGGSLAFVEAQAPDMPTETPPPSTSAADEAPPQATDVPTGNAAMNPIPDSGPSANVNPSGPPQPGQAVRLELPPLRIIEPGQAIPPPPRTRAPYAIIQALDKVTAQTIRFAAPVGQPVRYENLIFTVRACEATTTETPAPEAAAFMEVVSQPRPRVGYPTPPARQIFRGWMFASSPALHPLEHPVYDAWVIACSTAAPHAPAASS